MAEGRVLVSESSDEDNRGSHKPVGPIDNLQIARRLLLRVANDLEASSLVESLQEHEEILVKELAAALIDEGFLKEESENQNHQPYNCKTYGNFKIPTKSNRLVGEADCLVLASVGSVASSLLAVPKLPAKDQTSVEDELERVVEFIESDSLLDLPPLGPYRVEGEGKVVPVWLDGRGVRHSKKFYLKLIEDFLQLCKKPAAILWYTGLGQRGSGNWCFEDDVISLDDLICLYDTYFKGRLLTIVTDCSYSGNWAYMLASFLDSKEIVPCGHKAIEEGYLIKVYASCQPYQRSTMGWYVYNGVNVDESGHLAHHSQPGRPLDPTSRSPIPPPHTCTTQTTCNIDSTQLKCFEQHGNLCSFALENLRWMDIPNLPVLREYVHLVQDGNGWQCVLVHEEEEKTFQSLVKFGRTDVDFTKYGRVVCSGWGGEPPKEAISVFFDT